MQKLLESINMTKQRCGGVIKANSALGRMPTLSINLICQSNRKRILLLILIDSRLVGFLPRYQWSRILLRI